MLPKAYMKAMLSAISTKEAEAGRDFVVSQAISQGMALYPIKFGLPNPAPGSTYSDGDIFEQLNGTGANDPTKVIQVFQDFISTGLGTTRDFYFTRFYGTHVEVGVDDDLVPTITQKIGTRYGYDMQIPPVVYMYLGMADTVPGATLPDISQFPHNEQQIYWCVPIGSSHWREKTYNEGDENYDYSVGFPEDTPTGIDGEFITKTPFADTRGPQDIFLCISSPGLTDKFTFLTDLVVTLEDVEGVTPVDVLIAMEATVTDVDTAAVDTIDYGTFTATIGIVSTPVQRVTSIVRKIREGEFIDGRLVKLNDGSEETIYP